MIYKMPLLMLTAGLSAWLGVNIADRDAPTTIELQAPAGPAPIGGTLRVHYKVYRIRSCEQQHDVYIYDASGTRFTLRSVHYMAAPGPLGQSEFYEGLELPRDVLPGPARFNHVISYYCNFTHRFWPIVMVLPPMWFEISSDPASGGVNKP